MKCEEFEAIGLDAERDASLSEVERVSAREHAGTCSRRAAVVAAWALAAAAVLVGAVGWRNWRNGGRAGSASRSNSSASVANGSAKSANAYRETPAQSAAALRPDSADSEILLADSELSDFTLLPGAFIADTAEAAILRVRLQRGSLGSLGLPVNEE